jgi:hypothetical protein
MGNTRNVLKELGAQQSEEQLVEAGKKVLRDGVREFLASKGLTEAVGFEITLKNGEQFTILSDENPRMTTPMDQVQNIQPRQSAKAGGLEAILSDLLSVRLLF